MVRRLTLGLVVALVVMGLTPHPAAACLCGSPEEGRAGADVAFTGVVAAVEDPSFPGWFASTGDPILYTFAVEEVIRGFPDELTVVRSTRIEGSGSCAIDMAIGERWEIYAHWGMGTCGPAVAPAASGLPPASPRHRCQGAGHRACSSAYWLLESPR